jgi:hypothetical protein
MKARNLGPIMALLLGFALSIAPAHGGLDIDLGAAVRIGNNADLYIAISSRYFDQDRGAVERLGLRFDNPDDLAVCLFIARHSGRSGEQIFFLRRGGMSWWEIAARLDLRPDVWFVEVDRDPGPPYGKAYGYRNKQRQNRNYVWRLTDGEIRDLVAVRMVHEYYGMPVEAAMEVRATGKSLTLLMTEEYARRHGKGHHDKPGKSRGRNKRP